MDGTRIQYKSGSPTSAFRGSSLSGPMVVLAAPEVRAIKLITEPSRFNTIDGYVDGRAGDFAVVSQGKEQFPIRPSVFYGAYRILSRFGCDFIAERLVQVRRAWIVMQDGATMDYGEGRGVVSVERGSWLYQSDEGDFGTIHPSSQPASHIVVGPEEQVEINWTKRVKKVELWLVALPPLLSLLALAAFTATLSQDATTLIAIEVLLMIAGAAAAWLMHRDRWYLRSCVQTALVLGREFSAAVELLDQQPSWDFPGMAIWRAAQSQENVISKLGGTHSNLNYALRDACVRRLRLLDNGIRSSLNSEHATTMSTIAAFLIVLGANIILLLGDHATFLEVAVIWVPTVVSALRCLTSRARSAERVAAMRDFSDRLRFLHSWLLSDEASGPQRNSALRAVCLAAGDYCQRELRLALGATAPFPL